MADLDNHDDSFVGLSLQDVLPKDHKPWYKDRNLLKLHGVLLCALLTQTASGFDGSMLNGMQSLPAWEASFGKPEGTRLGAMTFGPTGGTLISILISSQLCERLGRRWPIFGGSLVIILGSALQAAAMNYATFVAARFLIGFGLGIVATAAPLLLTEASHPRYRGRLTSLYLTSWPLGSFIAAWITFGTFKWSTSAWSWRLPSLLQCVFSLIQVTLVLFAPESPRWLIYQNRHTEALAMLTKYHGGGDPTSRLVAFEMAEITATLEIEKMQKTSRWSQWLATPGNRHRLFLAAYIPAMLQWSGNALTSYYLSKVLKSIGITNSQTQLVINGCLSLWNLIVAIVIALSVEKAGRRRLFLTGMGCMGFAYIIWTICSALNLERNFKDKGLASAVVVMIFVFNGAYHLCSPIAPTYIMEVVPFSLRSKASMLYQLTGNLAGVYNSFANPVALEAIGWKYYIVWCCMIGVNFTLIYFFFPETKGHGLEEMAEIFDGPNAAAGVNAMKELGLDVKPSQAVQYDDAIAEEKTVVVHQERV